MSSPAESYSHDSGSKEIIAQPQDEKKTNQPTVKENNIISTVSETEKQWDRVDAGGVDMAFERKVFLMNSIMQDDIGMGKFQWQLFALSGFGWFADNLWLQGVAIILPEVGKEFFEARHTPWMTFSLYMGLICGAAFWGVAADVVGRRFSFNATLALGGIFGIAAGAAPSWVGLGGLLAGLGFGVGGSLPVDGMLFLEFIPGNRQWLLTFLSIFWAFGQLFASLVAWAFIANYTCAGSNSNPTTNGLCDVSQNMGWRYTFYTLGACTFAGFLLRFVVFQLPESPKYLLSHGRDAEAIAVMRDVARRNGVTIPEDRLSLTVLRALAGEDVSDVNEEEIVAPKTGLSAIVADFVAVPKQILAAVRGMNKDSFKPNTAHIKPLFATGKISYNTICLVFIWGLIGLGYPLYNAFLPTYLADRFSADAGVDATYRDYAIISACGVPGSIFAAWTVELPRSGRKGALALWTLLTGVFIFGLTGAKSNGAYLALNCVAAIVQNGMYGVLYGMTPESFPSIARGTGDGICSSFNRVTGAISPLVKIFSPNASPSAPLFTSGSLFIVAAVLGITLPIETAGKSAL